jgi:hypothetical protein
MPFATGNDVRRQKVPCERKNTPRGGLRAFAKGHSITSMSEAWNFLRSARGCDMVATADTEGPTWYYDLD